MPGIQVLDQDRPAFPEVGRIHTEARLSAEFTGLPGADGRHNKIHHPLGRRLVEPFGIFATGLPVHGELQNMHEFVRNDAFRQWPSVCKGSADGKKLEAFTVQNDVGGPVGAGVLTRWRLITEGPGTQAEETVGTVINVDRAVAAIAVLGRVGQRETAQERGLGGVDFLGNAGDQRRHFGTSRVVCGIQRLEVEDVEMRRRRSSIPIGQALRFAVDIGRSERRLFRRARTLVGLAGWRVGLGLGREAQALGEPAVGVDWRNQERPQKLLGGRRQIGHRRPKFTQQQVIRAG